MRILLIHNQYKQSGGEDSVFHAESDLLIHHGHDVAHLLFDNAHLTTLYDKCMAGLKAFYNPDSARILKDKVQEFNPEIIHVHNFLPLASPSIFFVAKRMGIPVILTLHNYRLICPSATLFFKGQIYERNVGTIISFDAILKGVYRNSILQTAIVSSMTAVHHFIGTWKNKVSGYIALTEFSREKFNLSTLSIDSNKLFVKPNFVEDRGAGALNRGDFFLFIGRLSEEKGIVTLLKAAAMNKSKLMIIGDGPMRGMVEECAKHNTNISFLGFQPTKVVIDYLKKCRALIFPSIWYEGLPITILEAFSTGTPVIASRLGSMKEIVLNRWNGLHFEPGNEQDLVGKMTKICEDSALAKTLSDNARKCYLDHYTPGINYNLLLSIYQTLLNKGKYSENQFEPMRVPMKMVNHQGAV